MHRNGVTGVALAILFSLCFFIACGDDGDNTPVDGDSNENTWEVSLTVSVNGQDHTIDLSTLDTTTFEDQDAIRLTRVIETVALDAPWNMHYNFVGNDGFSILDNKLEGDKGGLPYYGEMEHGFLYWETDDEGNTYIRVGWDESVDFPKFMKAKGMDGGTIEVSPIADTTVIMIAGEVRTAIDVTTLATTDVEDYKHPEDGLQPMVPLTAMFEAAGITDADGYTYRIIGNDGFANGDDNLMPYENATHTYMKPDNRAIVAEEAWDTQECCWRVKDVIVLQGVANAIAE